VDAYTRAGISGTFCPNILGHVLRPELADLTVPPRPSSCARRVGALVPRADGDRSLNERSRGLRSLNSAAEYPDLHQRVMDTAYGIPPGTRTSGCTHSCPQRPATTCEVDELVRIVEAGLQYPIDCVGNILMVNNLRGRQLCLARFLHKFELQLQIQLKRVLFPIRHSADLSNLLACPRL
jgi:hypothetical protein